jgi:hypothetical protein
MELHTLHRHGWSIAALAREFGLDWRTFCPAGPLLIPVGRDAAADRDRDYGAPDSLGVGSVKRSDAAMHPKSSVW